MMQIYLARNNQQAGPYSLEQVNQMLASQQVLLTDLIWHEGMTEWKTLGELTQGKLVYEPISSRPPFSPPIQSEVKTTSQATTKPVVQIASFSSRAFAKIVDMFLWFLPIATIPAFFFNADQHQQLQEIQQKLQTTQFASNQAVELQQQFIHMIPDQAWISILSYLLIMLLIQAFLIAKSGQSIGKKLARIKIVDIETHTTVSNLRSFWLRSMLFVVLNLLFMPFITIIDYALFLSNKNRQTLHDKLAKTKVVRK